MENYVCNAGAAKHLTPYLWWGMKGVVEEAWGASNLQQEQKAGHTTAHEEYIVGSLQMVQGERLLGPLSLLVSMRLLGLTPTRVMDELVQPAGHKASLQHPPDLFVEPASEGTARCHCPANLWWEEVTGGNMKLRLPSGWGEPVRQCRDNEVMLPCCLWLFLKVTLTRW